MSHRRDSTRPRAKLQGPGALYDLYNGLYSRSQVARIRGFVRAELKRSLKELNKPGRPRTYYLGYLFRNIRTEKIFARLGGISEHTIRSQNTLFCDLRVGSYRYDNVMSGGLNDNSDKAEAVDYINMPAELDEDAFKYAMWKLTDARFREASDQYFEKKSRAVHYVDENRRLPSRLRQNAVRDFHVRSFAKVDSDHWKQILRKAGQLTKKFTHIKNSYFELVIQHRQWLLVNSEGSEIFQQQAILELRGYFWLLSPRGEGITQEINLVAGDPADLPGEADFLGKVRERIEYILRLDRAEALSSYSGPVLLEAQPAGLFFHEVIGHRLEGSRLLSTDDGGTFRDMRGKAIAPDFVTIVDDPTIREFDGRRLIGHFLCDDEGSRSRRAVLVENGVLKSFLTGASPIPGQRELNGHARCQQYERPISRMGNLIVSTTNPVPRAELRARFLAEIRKQKKEYGICVKECVGGETDTGSYDFQAFKGEILVATKVFPDGREEPIRGVDFVGTPLSALEAVDCMADDAMLDNSFCGAESGIIPVSTIAPSMLLRSLELQGRDRERLTQYALPLPYGGNG